MESLVNNIDLFMILRKQSESLSYSTKLYDYLQQSLNLTDEKEVALRKFCQKFCSNINARWEKCSRSVAQFLRRNGDWLESPINWPQGIRTSLEVEISEQEVTQVGDDIENTPPQASTSSVPQASTSSLPQASTSSVPQAFTSLTTPRKPFVELCSKQKRRRVENVNASLSPEELNAATVKSLKCTGKDEIGKILQYLQDHPEDIEKVKACISQQTKPNSEYSPEKALALAVSLKLSKWQYINLRESASEQGTELYPSYYKVKQAKQSCYPAKEQINVTEDGASIKLQALLDLTVSRLLEAINFDLSAKKDLQLISKWGFDGASGQSNYKQKTSTDFDDSSVFMASLVPIRLQLCDGTVLWENDRPSSTFYCRPIMFKFMKENQLTVGNIKEGITGEIEILQPSKVQQVAVKHQLLLTMIDGKITSFLSETSTSVCDICKAKPSEMNNLESVDDRQKNEDMYQYGLSSLHAWIRSMECLLHIAYRLEFKQWSCRGENKEKMKTRKSEIQNVFKTDCGLLIDMVKQGAGTTNDGNTARRFFGDVDTTARITGVSNDLIERFHVILQTISSGERVDISKFRQFCRDTASLYIELYPWYYMPSSIHKLLIHGADIIQHFGIMPIGKLSEEAAEARNKDFRKFREHHSRKVSRTATNEDILHNLLLSSDPKLTSIRPRLAKNNKMVLPSKVRDLLLPLPSDPGQIEFIDVDLLQDSLSDSD